MLFPIIGKILLPVFHVKPAIVTGVLIAALFVLAFSTVDHIENGSIFFAICMAIQVGLALGITLLSTSALILILSRFPEQIPTAFVSFALFVCLLDATFSTSCLSYVPQAMYEASYVTGIAIGPVVGGFLYQSFGFAVPFLVAAAGGLISCCLNWIFIPVQEECSEFVCLPPTLLSNRCHDDQMRMTVRRFP